MNSSDREIGWQVSTETLIAIANGDTAASYDDGKLIAIELVIRRRRSGGATPGPALAARLDGWARVYLDRCLDGELGPEEAAQRAWAFASECEVQRRADLSALAGEVTDEG